ncbi:MAG: TetR/AcrR family transcriptional regulator [Bacillota bacterium]
MKKTKSAETKRLLLSTVKDLLSRTSDIKVKDITETAFVNIAAVNYHFDDKEKLVELAMQEIFVDFKYALNNFEAGNFESCDVAISGFIDMILNFVKNHIGFFQRIAQTGKHGIEYFHEEEFTSIATRQILSLGLDKSGEEITAIFASVLAQIVFAVLYFPTELESRENTEFLNTYFKQIKNSFK